MTKARMAALQKNMPEDLGAVLITSAVNRRYYTGFRSSAGTVLVTRKKSYLLIDSRYFEAAEATVQNCVVLLQEKLPQQLLKLLRQHKVKQLGIESKSVTVSGLQAWQKELAGVEICTDDRVSEQMAAQRAVKSAEEIRSIRAAQTIADAGFLHILNFIEAGKTETEIAVELEQYCRREGSEGAAFSYIIASGSNSSRPHAVPGDRQIQTGDFVTMDFGCLVDGYCSDMTRTVAVGTVNPQQRELYETVLAAQQAALQAVRAGTACKQVDKAARDIIDASEFKGMFGHGLGHSLGLEVHESPRCSAESTDTLATGMVTSVEPGIYLAGQYGARIEDIVVVTEAGCDNLCTSPKELIIL